MPQLLLTAALIMLLIATERNEVMWLLVFSAVASAAFTTYALVNRKKNMSGNMVLIAAALIYAALLVASLLVLEDTTLPQIPISVRLLAMLMDAVCMLYSLFTMLRI